MQERRIKRYTKEDNTDLARVHESFFNEEDAITENQVTTVVDSMVNDILDHSSQVDVDIEQYVISILDNSHLSKYIEAVQYDGTNTDHISASTDLILDAMEKIRERVLASLRSRLQGVIDFSVVERKLNISKKVNVARLDDGDVIKETPYRDLETLHMLARLEGHPGILFQTHSIDDENRIQRQAPLPPHRLLAELQTGATVPDKEVLKYFVDIIEAEQFLMRNGLVCTDITPDNIAIYEDSDGASHAALFDWDGLEETSKSCSNYFGKHEFIPPERQYIGFDDPVGEADVVHEIACAIYEVIQQSNSSTPVSSSFPDSPAGKRIMHYLAVLLFDSKRNERPSLDALKNVLESTLREFG